MDGIIRLDRIPLAGHMYGDTFGDETPSANFSHSWSFSRSFCNCMASSRDLMTLYKTLSSVKSLVVELGDTRSGKSLI